MSNGAGGLLVFNNTAARDSRMATPLVGQACLLIDTGEMLVYYGALFGWCLPWNTQWGEVTRVAIAAGGVAVTPIGFPYTASALPAIYMSYRPEPK